VANYKRGKDILNQRQRHLKENILSTAHKVLALLVWDNVTVIVRTYLSKYLVSLMTYPAFAYLPS
jgi:hypothetical protein